MKSASGRTEELIEKIAGTTTRKASYYKLKKTFPEGLVVSLKKS